MRILVVNKFWYSRGGQERVAIDEARWLAADGHAVAHFAAAHPENEYSEWAEYFSPYLEVGQGRELGLREQAIAVQRLFSNRPAEACFNRLIERFRPDVIHLHGIARQISPSILRPALKHCIPVVQTMHDYHHVCASGDLLRSGSDVCLPPQCGKLNVLPAVVNRCRQDSASVSLLLGCETAWAAVRGTYERSVVRYISPSRFLANVISETGWTRHAIDVIPNATDMSGKLTRSPSLTNGFVYAGRLSREKGIITLVEAAKQAEVHLSIAGEGPLEAEVRSLAGPDVEFLGRLSPHDVEKALIGARGAVLPSEWLENLPMGVIEAMAIGVPVIASRIGGIPEMVRDGIDGILFTPGDVGELTAALMRIKNSPDEAAAMGEAAAIRAREEFGKDQHLSRLMSTFELAIRGIST